MDCSDPNDRHVLAAAIAGEADILVSDNSGDFPAGTSSLPALALMTGDEAAAFLARLDPMRAARIARAQIADLVDPPSSEDEFLVDCQASAGVRHRFGICPWQCHLGQAHRGPGRGRPGIASVAGGDQSIQRNF